MLYCVRSGYRHWGTKGHNVASSSLSDTNAEQEDHRKPAHTCHPASTINWKQCILSHWISPGSPAEGREFKSWQQNQRQLLLKFSGTCMYSKLHTCYMCTGPISNLCKLFGWLFNLCEPPCAPDSWLCQLGHLVVTLTLILNPYPNSFTILPKPCLILGYVCLHLVASAAPPTPLPTICFLPSTSDVYWIASSECDSIILSWALHVLPCLSDC